MLNELIYFLASLYNTPEDIRGVMSLSGLKDNIPFIPAHSKPTVYWSNIVFYLQDRNKLDQLIKGVLRDGNQDNQYLNAVLQDKNTSFRSPYFKTSVDKSLLVEEPSLEKLTRGESTLLPISFLEKGIVRSKAVVKLVTDESLGTGIIIQNGYLLTNNHVIDSIETAASTEVQLNYQKSFTGRMLPYVSKYLDPYAENGFATSVENDWTVVKIKDYTAEDENIYGSVKLANTTVIKNDFVNIIQHPGGEAKQIALYHNVVVACDAERIQYLTDTQPGSSGAPVFNSNWDVVALHHAGGEIKVRGTQKVELLNEGININLVLQEIVNAGIPINCGHEAILEK